MEIKINKNIGERGGDKNFLKKKKNSVKEMEIKISDDALEFE